MSRNTAAAVQHDNDPGQLRAVIYARYSCSAQNEQSIEGQLEDCHAYAERCGLLVVGQYVDRALTGRSDDRPSFQSMIEDAKKGQFERVIVWKLDRFSRNRYDSAMYKYKLKQCGVLVVSAMENIGDGDESVILEAVLEATAEYYSRDLAKKVLRGMRDTAAKGMSTGSKPPYGYKLVEGAPVAGRRRAPMFPAPDGERAEFVRWAYEQYAAGLVMTEIAAEMKRRGLDTVNGRPVTYNTLWGMMRNEKYKGVGKWGEIEVPWPAIVDADLWEKVRARREANKRAPGAAKARVRYDLLGKLFCGYCAEPMIGTAGTGKSGEVHRYYSCRGRKKLRNGCKKAHEEKGFLEWYVVEQTLLYVLAPDRVHLIAERVVAMYDAEFSSAGVDELQKRLDAVERQLDKTTELLFAAPSKAAVDRINSHVVELEAQKDEIAVELAKQKIASGIRYTVPDVEAWLKGFAAGDACDENFRRRIIEVFINAVYLYDDRVVIYYNLKGGKQVSVIGLQDSDADIAVDGGLLEGRGVRTSLGTVHQIKPNTNTVHYVFVGGVFGIVCERGGE